MNKPYLLLLNNKLYTKHVTRNGALKHIEDLKSKGINVVLAYALTGYEKRD